MKHRAALLGLMALLGGQPAGAEDAWWIGAEFKPIGLEVAGLSINVISPSWVAASEMAKLPLPPAAMEPGERLQDHEASFERIVDLDQNGSLERAVVGVYASRDGATGRFLAIMPAPNPEGTLLALFETPGSAGFSVLTLDGSRLVWAPCMECDSGCAVQMVPPPPRLECDKIDD